MRILFLSQVLPYPVDAGPKMRSYFVLRYLVQHHEVTLLTFVRDTDRAEDIAHLAELCHAVHTVSIRRNRWRDIKFLAQSVLTRQPFLIIRDQFPEMTNAVARLMHTHTFDAVHADQLWMAQYALEAGSVASRPDRDPDAAPRLILDQHNAVYLIPTRMANGESNPVKKRLLSRESSLLAAYELDMCDQFNHIVWVTEEDRQAVAKLSSSALNHHPISTVIPICADPEQVLPVEHLARKQRITFLGGLHWPPNAEGIVWFADHVFPQIRTNVPNAVLTVIGKSPPPGLQDVEGIEVTGYVSDLKPYLDETAAFIVPLHAGGGMRVKILDAWSWGLPVVSTAIGAEGMAIRPGTNILIADTALAFAQAVVQVLNDPSFARQLGYNGRQTILDRYNWRTTYSAWDSVYRHCPSLTS